MEVQAPSEVLPGLWQSGLPEDYAQVRSAYGVVIDLADVGSGPGTPEDVAGITYVKAPLIDGDGLPDPLLLFGLTALVADELRRSRTVLVHCTYGKNRSGLLMTLIVRERLGCTGAQALRRVRDVRHRAVNNDTFAAWLEALPAP